MSGGVVNRRLRPTVRVYRQPRVITNISVAVSTTIGAHSVSAASHEVSLAALSTVGVEERTAVAHNISTAASAVTGARVSADIGHEAAIASRTTAGVEALTLYNHNVSLASLTTIAAYTADNAPAPSVPTLTSVALDLQSGLIASELVPTLGAASTFAFDMVAGRVGEFLPTVTGSVGVLTTASIAPSAVTVRTSPVVSVVDAAAHPLSANTQSRSIVTSATAGVEARSAIGSHNVSVACYVGAAVHPLSATVHSLPTVSGAAVGAHPTSTTLRSTSISVRTTVGAYFAESSAINPNTSLGLDMLSGLLVYETIPAIAGVVFAFDLAAGRVGEFTEPVPPFTDHPIAVRTTAGVGVSVATSRALGLTSVVTAGASTSIGNGWAQLLDESGNPIVIYPPILDEFGNPIFDEFGNPILEDIAVPIIVTSQGSVKTSNISTRTFGSLYVNVVATAATGTLAIGVLTTIGVSTNVGGMIPIGVLTTAGVNPRTAVVHSATTSALVSAAAGQAATTGHTVTAFSVTYIAAGVYLFRPIPSTTSARTIIVTRTAVGSMA